MRPRLNYRLKAEEEEEVQLGVRLHLTVSKISVINYGLPHILGLAGKESTGTGLTLKNSLVIQKVLFVNESLFFTNKPEFVFVTLPTDADNEAE